MKYGDTFFGGSKIRPLIQSFWNLELGLRKHNSSYTRNFMPLPKTNKQKNKTKTQPYEKCKYTRLILHYFLWRSLNKMILIRYDRAGNWNFWKISNLNTILVLWFGISENANIFQVQYTQSQTKQIFAYPYSDCIFKKNWDIFHKYCMKLASRPLQQMDCQNVAPSHGSVFVTLLSGLIRATRVAKILKTHLKKH